jgi:tetraacyldisaccharide 4'-kinase
MGRLRERVEGYLNGLWYGNAKPGLAWRALSGVYGLAARRRVPAKRGPLPGPVIVVGNITVGGGGKTPVVAALAAALVDEGRRVAVISRGYGGQSPLRPLRVQAGDDPQVCGDEPLLLARSTGCPVWVCRKRRLAMQAAFDDGAEVVLSDDGLQHADLPRSFEICVIDEARGFGNGRLLPAGPLRQPLERLGQVDLVLRKSIGLAPEQADLPGVAFAIEPGNAYRLEDRQPIDLVCMQPFDAVCGIANPDSFFATLAMLGLEFRRHAFPDHHAFARSDLAGLEGPLVVTEKDAVKLDRLDALPETVVLPIRARLPEQALQVIRAHVREFARS